MAYCRTITIGPLADLDEDLENFPLRIALEDASLRSESEGGRIASPDGGDIHFTSVDGKELAFELLKYDAVSGGLEAWVGIPRLERACDTEIVLRYGSADRAGRGAGSVWDRNHRLVRHPNTSSGDHESIPHTEELDISEAITVEAWFHSDQSRSDAFQTLVSKWSLRANMDAFESYDGGETDGLNTKGFFGSVCDGRYVYFVPQFNGDERHAQALRYDGHGDFEDPKSWSAYDAGNTSGLISKGYYGAVHAGDYIYYVPRRDDVGYHTRLLRYDRRRDFRDAGAWVAYDTGYDISCQSGAYDGRFIYLSPGYEGDPSRNSGKVVRYDTEGEFTDPSSYAMYDAGETAGLGSRCYDGACFDGRYVYFAPLAAGENEGIALRLDTEGDFSSPASWSAMDGKGVGLGTCVGAVYDGRFIYYVPYARSMAVRYDTYGSFDDPESWEAYNAAGTTGMNTKGYDGGCFDGRYIYYVPFHEGENSRDGFHCRLLRYDTMKGFDDPSAWDAADGGVYTYPPNPGGFNGGAFDGRFVYFAPWREDPDDSDTRQFTPHGKVLRYDTTDADAAFMLKYAECGHNGGLCASLPGPTFSINTSAGVRNVRANRCLEPGWHHVAGVFDGSRLGLYVDGVSVGETEATGPIRTGQADVGIGRIASGGAQFSGHIAHVRISDVARSPGWIRATAESLKDPEGFVRVEEEQAA